MYGKSIGSALAAADEEIEALEAGARKLREENEALRAERDRLQEGLERSEKGRAELVVRYDDVLCALAAENAVLRGTIRWALGEEGEFRTPVIGEGRFWWRTELRQRASEPSPLTSAVQRVLEAVGRLSEALNDLGDADKGRPAEVPVAEERVGSRVGEVVAAHDHLQALLEGREGR